jgi:predicted RNase H-like nuclease (RuvC/YqgF family)
MIDPTTLRDLGAGALLVLALFIIYLVARVLTPVLVGTTNTLKEALEGQRLFYQQRLDELAKEHKLEIEELRERVRDLESENLTLKNKNAELQAELETLRKRFNHEGTTRRRR